MVLPILAGLAIGARLLIPKLLPLARKFVIPFAKKVISKLTFKRVAIGSVVIGAALESGTIRDIIKKVPTAPFKAGKKIGAFVEREIAPEEEVSPIKKALAIGGIVGLAGAAALVGVKKIKEKRAAAAVIAAAAPAGILPSPTALVPLSPAAPAVLPVAEIISPTAVVVPKKVKRAVKRKVSPLVINQIQISQSN